MPYNYEAIAPQPLAATIPNTGTTSSEIDLQGSTLLGFFFPAALTGTTVKISAASISGGTFLNVQKDEAGGGDYTVTFTASKYVPVTNLSILKGLRYLKLISSATEAADRIITLAVAPI